MTAYYNEHNTFAAAWLRELIKAGLIAPGDVDDRSIADVRADELLGYRQCHFFAGIGVWSYALRQAGWPDDRPVWTGSCPCQPFSAAGKGKGFDDDRHLWPTWFSLIEKCRPGTVFGEQVASKDGLAWLDLVQTDLEGADYASGAVDICAAGVGAPHIRQRLFFVAERLADANNPGPQGWEIGRDGTDQFTIGSGSVVSRLDNPLRGRHQPEDEEIRPGRVGAELSCGDNRPGPTNGLWAASDWLHCRDGKFRPVEPGTFPLVDGTPARVGRLRGYGNAINAEVARVFIESYMDTYHALTGAQQ